MDELREKIRAIVKDMKWVGECDNPPCDKGRVWHVQSVTATIPMDCPKCNGTGTITRPATIEEVMQVASDLIDSAPYPFRLNGSRPRIKE